MAKTESQGGTTTAQQPGTQAQQGKEIELVVDTGRLHFFDPDTGRGIYDGEPASTGTRTTG